MARGLLQSATLTTTSTAVFTPTSTLTALVNINLCNITNNPVKYRIAISNTASATSASWLVYDNVILSNGTATLTNIMITSGQYIIASCDTANAVALNIMGYEEGVL